MARQEVIRVTLVDDLDGTTIRAAEREALVRFAHEGTTYELHLNKKNQRQLERALAPYKAVARKVPKSK